jgi:hypothetical protein
MDKIHPADLNDPVALELRFIQKAIDETITATVARIIESEIGRIKDRISNEIRGQIGAISGKIFKEFGMRSYGDRITISVSTKDLNL